MSSNVRPDSMARITTKELADKFIDEQVAAIKLASMGVTIDALTDEQIAYMNQVD